MRRFILPALALATVAACGSDSTGPGNVPCHPFLTSFSTAPGDTIDASSEVRYIDVEAGSDGAAAPGRTVFVNYTGYTVEGETFDSSCTMAREVLDFTLGTGSVIPGFEIGLLGLKKNGVRRVFVPTEAGYPPGTLDWSGNPHPLAGLDLIFDIELVEIW